MELEAVTSDHAITYFVRGHVGFDVLTGLISSEYGASEINDIEPVRHSFFRVRPDNSGEYSCWYYPVDRGGRGAFPVTYTWKNW